MWQSKPSDGNKTGHATTKNPNILCHPLWHAHYIHPHFRDLQCISWASIMIGHVFLLFFKPIDYQTLNTITPATPTTTFGNRPRLDIATLQGAVCQYPGNGITLTTKRMYASGITRERERGEMERERGEIRNTTLNIFLHTNTMSTNTYLWKHPPTMCGSPGHATIITHINQGLCISHTQSTCYQWKPSSLHHTIDSSPPNGPQWHQKRSSYNQVNQG